MNAIEIVRRACRSLGIPSPSSAVGSSDLQIVQILNLLNDEGMELSGEIEWESLTNEATFTTVATESQGTVESIIGAANDYRYIINDTIFNRSRREPIFGPKAARDWQAQKSLNLTGPWPQYRIRGGEILFDPVPTAGESCYFEYVTNNWVTSSDGMSKRSEIADDEDIFLLPDDVLLLGVKWRWLEAKGLDFTQAFDSYSRRAADAKARDGTKRTLSLDSTADRYRYGIVTPVGSWDL